jgi:60 kDa SS-A/Ro ribonucleoprotein
MSHDGPLGDGDAFRFHPLHERVRDVVRVDNLNVGGFSDAVFQVVAAFFTGDSGRFVSEVEAVQL